jgi:hypothetical protein
MGCIHRKTEVISTYIFFPLSPFLYSAQIFLHLFMLSLQGLLAHVVEWGSIHCKDLPQPQCIPVNTQRGILKWGGHMRLCLLLCVLPSYKLNIFIAHCRAAPLSLNSQPLCDICGAGVNPRELHRGGKPPVPAINNTQCFLGCYM